MSSRSILSSLAVTDSIYCLSFTIIGYDASTHLCEEALDPGRLAPIAIFGGVAIVGLVGFAYIIALLFCIGDVDSVLNTPTYVPTIQIFMDSFGLRGATAAYCFNLLILAFACIGGPSTAHLLQQRGLT